MSNKYDFDNVINKLDEVALSLYNAQDTLVRDVTDALSKLEIHKMDPDAHGFRDPNSEFRQLLNNIINKNIGDSASNDEFITNLINKLIESGKLSDSINSNDSNSFASSKAVKAVYDSLLNQLNAHKNDKNNPHGVTKAQLGLGSLPDNLIVSDAVNSTSSTALATSKAVKEAYDAAVAANNNANNRVAKAGDTMTGNLIISKDGPVLDLKDTVLNTAAAPSADTYKTNIYFRDKSNVNFGYIQTVYLRNRTQGLRFCGVKNVNGEKVSALGLYVDANGTPFTEVITPAASDSSTKIANTSWVQAAIKSKMDTYVVVATTTKAGMVKPDGKTIKVSADGTISVDAISVATTAVAGTVKPDGKTILIDANGVISVNAVDTATAGAIVKRRSDGTITGSITGNAYWADLAEIYHSNDKLEVGEIVTIAKSGEGDICKAKIEDEYILGVVSRDPGVILNHKDMNKPNRYPIARVGIVEILVTGPIRKGDSISIYDNGVACKSPNGFAHAIETNLDNETKLVKCII